MTPNSNSKVRVQTVKIEFPDHEKMVLTNSSGDTYTTKSEELMDFFMPASTPPANTNEDADLTIELKPISVKPEKFGKYWCLVKPLPIPYQLNLTVLEYGEDDEGNVGFLSEDDDFKVTYWFPYAPIAKANTNARLFTLDEMKEYGEFIEEMEWNNHFGPIPNLCPTKDQYFLEKFNIKL